MLALLSPCDPEESGSEFSVMGDIWCLLGISASTPDIRPVSRSEKKPLESISAAKESAMELEEIMEEGMLADMLDMPVSVESPSLRPVTESPIQSGLLRLQSEPSLLEVLDTI